MNNNQFRRLVMDTPGEAPSSSASLGQTPRREGGKLPSLGSRMRSSLGAMTPRSVVGSSGIDFARQLREHNAAQNPTTTKKFRSSVAPRGAKLPAGYQDRTQQRISEDEDDKAARVRALEEMVKLGQMEQSAFEAVRDEIIGGDVKNVHLVKGLDFKLLERVRRGEDVMAEKQDGAATEKSPVDKIEDADEAFEDLEDKEVKPIAKEEKSKKGSMAPPSLLGKKRTRDDILKELKASRLKAEEEKAARQPTLGPKFKKLGEKSTKPVIETDERGREVLITVDEDGNVKRKIRKVKVQAPSQAAGLMMPAKDAKPLGMEVPENLHPPPPSGEDEDGDIFEGIGNDYDPLGDEEASASSSDEGEVPATQPKSNEESLSPSTNETESAQSATKSPSPSQASPPPPAPAIAMPPPPKPPSKPRNYFTSTSPPPTSSTAPPSTTPPNPLSDPTILAALKKASAIAADHPLTTSSDEAAKQARHKALLEARDRDADDMDMEFGSSRFGDAEEEGEGKKVRLSVWNGGKDDEDEKGGGKGKGKGGDKGEGGGGRKRGKKKRKGDGESFKDVMGVLEGRRKGGGGLETGLLSSSLRACVEQHTALTGAIHSEDLVKNRSRDVPARQSTGRKSTTYSITL